MHELINEIVFEVEILMKYQSKMYQRRIPYGWLITKNTINLNHKDRIMIERIAHKLTRKQCYSALDELRKSTKDNQPTIEDIPKLFLDLLNRQQDMQTMNTVSTENRNRYNRSSVFSNLLLFVNSIRRRRHARFEMKEIKQYNGFVESDS